MPRFTRGSTDMRVPGRLPICLAGLVGFAIAVAVGAGGRLWLAGGAPDRFDLLLRRALGEVDSEVQLGLGHEERDRFITECRADMRTDYDEELRRKGEAHENIRHLFENNFRKEELDRFYVADPRVAEHLLSIVTEYDGKLHAVFIDGADWPDFYPRGRFGIGWWNLFKERVFDRLVAWRRGGTDLVLDRGLR